MQLRARNSIWSELPEYHGRSNVELRNLHGELPIFGAPYRYHNQYRIKATIDNKSTTHYFIDILDKYQGYLINSLNNIAQAKDESIVTCKEWNDFVEWVMFIGVKYVCFLSYRTVCKCRHIFCFGIRASFFFLLVFFFFDFFVAEWTIPKTEYNCES